MRSRDLDRTRGNSGRLSERLLSGVPPTNRNKSLWWRGLVLALALGMLWIRILRSVLRRIGCPCFRDEDPSTAGIASTNAAGEDSMPHERFTDTVSNFSEEAPSNTVCVNQRDGGALIHDERVDEVISNSIQWRIRHADELERPAIWSRVWSACDTRVQGEAGSGVRFVWIHGVPGAGKSVLAERVLERMHAKGDRTLVWKIDGGNVESQVEQLWQRVIAIKQKCEEVSEDYDAESHINSICTRLEKVLLDVPGFCIVIDQCDAAPSIACHEAVMDDDSVISVNGRSFHSDRDSEETATCAEWERLVMHCASNADLRGTVVVTSSSLPQPAHLNRRPVELVHVDKLQPDEARQLLLQNMQSPESILNGHAAVLDSIIRSSNYNAQAIVTAATLFARDHDPSVVMHPTISTNSLLLSVMNKLSTPAKNLTATLSVFGPAWIPADVVDEASRLCGTDRSVIEELCSKRVLDRTRGETKGYLLSSAVLSVIQGTAGEWFENARDVCTTADNAFGRRNHSRTPSASSVDSCGNDGAPLLNAAAKAVRLAWIQSTSRNARANDIAGTLGLIALCDRICELYACLLIESVADDVDHDILRPFLEVLHSLCMLWLSLRQPTKALPVLQTSLRLLAASAPIPDDLSDDENRVSMNNPDDVISLGFEPRERQTTATVRRDIAMLRTLHSLAGVYSRLGHWDRQKELLDCASLMECTSFGVKD